MARKKVQAQDVMSAPNVIPMADIMLVLLIIFMVVTPMLQKGTAVDMARVQLPEDLPDADKDDAVIVAVTRDGYLFLGNTRTELDVVSSQVRDLISGRMDKTVFIKSDGRALYGDVVKLVDEVRSAGVDNVGLLTDKLETGQPTPPPAD
jgi:biopolymer transport protein ExbD/biopolymer transport protein TolR